MSAVTTRPLRAMCIFLLAIWVSACSERAATPEPVRAVRVMQVDGAPMAVQPEYAAELLPRAESRQGFRVGGKVVRRPVQVGQHVKAGQLLAQLDPSDYRLSADASKAQLASAQTNLDLALAELKRFASLREQNFISAAELERREAQYRSALSQLQQAQAQAASQANQAGYTSLLADVSGVVTAVDMELGQVVGAAAPVVRIAQDGPRDAVFAVPEDQIGAMQVGMAADVRVWASGVLLSGVVREMAPSADPLTRTFAVKVALRGAQTLPLGSTVSVIPRVSLTADRQGMVLPINALVRKDQQTAVWVLDGASMTVKRTEVELGAIQGNGVVVKAGLRPGDQVVTAGVHMLAEGQKVSRYQPPTAAAASSMDK